MQHPPNYSKKKIGPHNKIVHIPIFLGEINIIFFELLFHSLIMIRKMNKKNLFFITSSMQVEVSASSL